MARYRLFVLKMPLNPKQTNKQTIMLGFSGICKGVWLLMCWGTIW